jgi:hypothetical protein
LGAAGLEAFASLPGSDEPLTSAKQCLPSPKLSCGVPFDLDGVGALAPVFKTHTSNEPQLCGANCAMSIPGAAHIDQSYWKGNAEKHTGESNAEACHDVTPLAKASIK